MKSQYLIALAVRLFAIALAISVLQSAVTTVPLLYGQKSQEFFYLFIAMIVLFLVVAIGLWKFPLTVARGLVNFREPAKTESSSTPPEQIQVVAFTVLGVYLLFSVVSDIFYWVLVWFIGQRNPILAMEITIHDKALMFATVIEFIFVLFLIFGAKRLVEILHKARYGGNV